MDAKKEMKKSDKLRLDLISTIIVTLIALAVTVAAVISMAWFASNKETTGEGMGVSVAGERYSLSFLSNDDSVYEADRRKIEGYNETALTWKMTAENNMYNHENNQSGVYPGSEGVISFYITRRVEEAITLDFDLTVEAYAYERISRENGETGVNLNKVEQFQNEEIAKLLLGHIMLFESRESKAGKYTYSRPILPDENGVRRLQKVFDASTETAGDKKTLVNIYWVWPYTLSTIVKVPTVETVPFMEVNSDDYEAVLENVCSNPGYYLKLEDESVTPLNANELTGNYKKYGDLYDRSDNDIGNLVDFMLITMNVEEEGEAGGDAG